MRTLLLAMAMAGVASAATPGTPATGASAPAAAVGAAASKSVVFDEAVSTHEWPLAELDAALPADWSGYDFLVLEMRASSGQRFELGLRTDKQLISKRVHPMPGVWVRAAIPLRFFRNGLGNANDLAATVNQPRDSYWINIEAGGYGPTTDVRGLSVVMRYPVGSPTLEVRSVSLSKTDPGDAVLDGGGPVVDAFGQYARVAWPGKARDGDDLRRAWLAEAEALPRQAVPDRCKYGGFASTRARATGFFRVEKIDGRWWFVCPEGHLFYSTGVNGIGTAMGTRVAGREAMFPALPASLLAAATTFPATAPATEPAAERATTAATGPAGRRGRQPQQMSYYTANLQRRFGSEFRPNWAALTAQRLDAWGINTSYGTALNDALPGTDRDKPYVMNLRGTGQQGGLIMGMPDVYSDAFVEQADANIARAVAPRKDDPYLLGYFIGNEPPWPGRESQFVDLVLAGGPTKMNEKFQADLAAGGDTPERRRDLVVAAFERYLAVVNASLKKHDPNHLNLGIRFGGTPPDYVVAVCRGFDVYSLNKYRWEPPPELLKKVYGLTGGLPILIGEFHMGVPGRGLAPGLVQVMNQAERGVAYRYYVEHAAAHPEVIGTHWFQWIDQPATGRGDGENYNIGMIDVTDRPYDELVNAARATHERLLDIHSGKLPPTDRRAKTSEVGTPAETSQLGRPAIQ